MVKDVHFVFYHYNPSLVAAAVFIGLFAKSTLVHIFQLVYHRTWYFIPFVIGGLFETIGYGGRVGSALESPNWTKGPYIMQSLLLLIAPAFFAASIYMILGRIITLVDGAEHSVIPTRWLTKVFVTVDVISFLTQGAGSGLLASAKDADGFKTGENVIVGGLFIQLVGFSVFVIVAAIFHRRMLQHPTATSRAINVPWQRHLIVLYAVSGLILIRSIFRIIEYIQGYDGSLQNAEYWLYIFDAALMFVAMVLLNVFHPSKIMKATTNAKAMESSDIEQQEMRPAFN